MALPVNVPRAPGVPNVLFAAGVDIVRFLTRDAVGLFLGAPSAPWGIYNGGSAVVTAQSVTAFDYRKQYSISDYPIEDGQFESYDKVELPADVIFRFATGGNDAQRAAMISSIRAALKTLIRYTIVTPDAVYQSFNLTHMDFSRNAVNNLGLLQIDVWGMEVRVGASVSTNSTKSPDVATQTNTGPVQSTDPTTDQRTTTTTIVGPPLPWQGVT